MKRKVISRTIGLLSVVSLLADLASQMLYPILPVYWLSIGFSAALIGLLEGIAEITTGLSKDFFGRLSHQSGRRLPLVRVGYALSALAKPLTVLSALPVWVFTTRTLDRIGKGLRTTARDGVLTDESAPQSRTAVFGFQRSVNLLGAVLGPLAALVYLYFFPGQYLTLFMLALGPGLLAAGLTLLVTDPPSPSSPEWTPPLTDPPASVFDFTYYWRESSSEYRQVMSGLFVFALFKSSDVFLLLKLKQVGLEDTVIVVLYVFYNLVYALLAHPVGRLADRIGLKPTLLVGLGLFAFVYEGMAIAERLPVLAGLLALYGLYAAVTEGIAKAWISTISGPWHTTTAVGTYTRLSSVGAFVANVMAGGLWYAFGAPLMFALTGLVTGWVILYLASLEGLPRQVAAVRKPGVVITTDGDLTGSDSAPYAVEYSPPTPLLRRPTYWALILLTACLGLGTVYISYVALSRVLHSPAPLTVRSEPPGRSRFWPPAAGPMRTPRPTNPTPVGNSPSNPPTPSAKPSLAGRYEISAPTGSARQLPLVTQLLTDKRPPAPWLNLPLQAIPPKALLVNNSTKKLADPLRTKPAPPPASKRRPVRLYTVSSLYTHLYERADKRSRRKPFLNVGKKVVLTALLERNGFIYVVYSTRKGRTQKGWLRKGAVRRVQLPTDLYSG